VGTPSARSLAVTLLLLILLQSCILQCLLDKPQCPIGTVIYSVTNIDYRYYRLFCSCADGCMYTDRKPLHVGDLFPNLIIKNLIDEQNIYCQYGIKKGSGVAVWIRDETGCPEVIKFKNREGHYKVCGFAPLQCPYCANAVKRRDLDTHQAQCPLRPTQCTKCEKQEIPYCDIEVSSLCSISNGYSSYSHRGT
jgi:hypothetical protein